VNQKTYYVLMTSTGPWERVTRSSTPERIPCWRQHYIIRILNNRKITRFITRIFDNIIKELRQLGEKVRAPPWLLHQHASEYKPNLYPELQISFGLSCLTHWEQNTSFTVRAAIRKIISGGRQRRWLWTGRCS